MWKFSLLVIVIALAAGACRPKDMDTGNGSISASGESVPLVDVVSLVCGPEGDCFSEICADAEKCPLRIALSDKAIFDFVTTVSECDGCNTPAFSPPKGVGKCVEYKTTTALQSWMIKFWVSENCDFRHADPTQTSLSVKINSTTLAIEHIEPAIEYVKNASYCRVDSDCKSLSGSGLPLIGCGNFFYAPLNPSGYYSGDDCVCAANQCTQEPG